MKKLSIVLLMLTTVYVLAGRVVFRYPAPKKCTLLEHIDAAAHDPLDVTFAHTQVFAWHEGTLQSYGSIECVQKNSNFRSVLAEGKYAYTQQADVLIIGIKTTDSAKRAQPIALKHKKIQSKL